MTMFVGHCCKYLVASSGEIAMMYAVCAVRSVPSQVVLSRTLNKKQMLMSVATKIAIQLNCKMGGEVWALEIPVT